MLKFSKRHKLKKVRYFLEVIWFIYLSCPLKVFFSIFSSGNHFVQQSRTILAILAKGHKRSIDVKSFCNLTTGHGDVVQRFFSFFSSGDHFVQQSRTILTILVKGDNRAISVKSF